MRKFLHRSILLALGMGLCANITLADTPATYMDGPDRIFQVSVPDFWNLRTGGMREIAPDAADELRSVERVFGLSPEKDHGVWMGLISPPQFRNLQDAKNYARSLSGQLAKSTKITGNMDRRVAGYPATVIEGTGRRNGKSVNFTVVLMDLKTGRVVIGLTVLEHGHDPNALADVNAILQSIKAR